MIMGRSYHGNIAPWGSTVICKELPKVKEKGEMWTKGIFVGKDHLSNLNMISASKGVVKARTMRRCANQYQAEVLLYARGTPWDLTLDAITGRKRKEIAGGPVLSRDAPKALEEQKGRQDGPAEHYIGDEAASDPESAEGSSDAKKKERILITLEVHVETKERRRLRKAFCHQ